MHTARLLRVIATFGALRPRGRRLDCLGHRSARHGHPLATYAITSGGAHLIVILKSLSVSIRWLVVSLRRWVPVSLDPGEALRIKPESAGIVNHRRPAALPLIGEVTFTGMAAAFPG